ncbi:hypothetical protein, conserved [Eimeria maxima]|uniref:Uncharacterized protein n=1 Tax=Eimeria maxima TaxID=5804 RepID=U6M672_EIMMA|nr:hypothetical protein, conserved [Eimeria maxima]CDJ57165.1 hypothetical protein, conserved [Eimeria maxima]
MDPVDMEAWEASQRRVVRTRWLPTPSGVFFQGRKLAASLALHIHQASPVAAPASLAAVASAAARRQSLRGSFGQETVNAVAHRLLSLEAHSLTPWLPSFVTLLHQPFALQRQLAEHLAAAAEPLLLQQQEQQPAAVEWLVQQTLRDADPGLLGWAQPALLPPRLLLQICGGLLGAGSYELSMEMARRFFSSIKEYLKRAAAVRSSSSENNSGSSSCTMLLPLRDVAFFYSALKHSGIREPETVRLLLLQLQEDLLRVAGDSKATTAVAATAAAGHKDDGSTEADAAAATEAATTTAAEAERLLAVAEGGAADLCAVLDAAAFGCRTPAAAAAAAAATTTEALEAAENEVAAEFGAMFELAWRMLLPLTPRLAPPCGLLLFNAVAAGGPQAVLTSPAYLESVEAFLSSHSDLDPEALGTISI